MRPRRPTSLAFVLATAVLVASSAVSTDGEQARRTGLEKQPTTPWGDPEFEGVWNYATMTPLERPRDFADKEVLTPAEAATFEQRTTERQGATNATAGPDWWDPGTRHLSDRRTSLIVDPADGRLPPMTEAARKSAEARAEARRRRGPADGPEDLALNERCLQWATAGPPMLPGVYNNNVQFIQTPAEVVIFNEMIHDARIVHMDDRPGTGVRRWMGESRGHWEGPTLVVGTVNFGDRTSVRGSDGNLRLVERFTRVDADTIEYRFTVDDDTVWTRPWTVALPMHRTDGPVYEYACHEGNARSVEGILRGARTQDAVR